MKYQLFVSTPDSTIPRLCTFTVIYDSIIAFHMVSTLYDVWIHKGKLKEIIAENKCLTPNDCEIFTKR